MENIKDEDMIDENSIKKLIKDGYSLKLLSFEFDIPMNLLNQYDKEIKEEIKLEEQKKRKAEEERLKLEQREKEEEKKKLEEQKRSKRVRAERNTETTLTIPTKMELLRQNYMNLYYKTEKKVEKIENQTEEEHDIVEGIIKEIEEKISEIEKADIIETRQLCRNLLEEINKLSNCNLLYEQLSRITKLIVSPRVEGKNIVGISRKDMDFLNKRKQDFARKYSNAIKEQIDKTTDITLLKKLKSDITRELKNKYPIDFDSIVIVINSKIDRLKQNVQIQQVTIPIGVVNIVKGLANGKLDLNYATQIINQEVNRRLQVGPKNKFSLSEDEVRNQIYSQISTDLGKNGEKYPIENAENTILLFEQMQGNLTSFNIRGVIKNFIACKKFDEARDILHKYSTKPHNILEIVERNILEDEIRKEELGNIIMKGIEGKDIKKEEEDAYFKLIEKGIKQGNINMSQISLGMSKDGEKKITLADIWIRPIQKMQSPR